MTQLLGKLVYRCLRYTALFGFSLGLLSSLTFVRAEKIDPIWPTPNQAYFKGQALTEFIQPTASGEVESGLFGCVRSAGRQFHEGLDLKPTQRNRNGEPTDPIYAVLSGLVRHVSRVPGASNYGRYIVIEHSENSLPVNTLYAHLSSVADGIKVGTRVVQGQVIATMGRSSSGNAIPRDRAHLHFEINLMLSRNFQAWYNWKQFGSRNEHNLWNGINLIGIDPLDFYNELRGGQVDGFAQYFSRLKPIVRVKIATQTIPDFIERYPTLRTRPLPVADALAGWEILVNEHGLPFSWTPLGPGDVAGMKNNEIIAAPVDPSERLPHCKSLVFKKRGQYGIGRDLESTLQLLFDLRREL